jgi:hypothetical protein
MHRLLMVGLLAGGLLLGSAGTAAAFDFVPPVVPPELMMNAPALPAQAPGPGPTQVGGSGVSWARDGAPGLAQQVLPGSQWNSRGPELAGCGLWDWNSC